MTKNEAVILSAYTGIVMCDFSDIHEYTEKVLKRPIWTHEFASEDLWVEIREKVKPAFLEICSNLTD